MDRTQIIHYQGKKILFIDFSNLQTADEIRAIAQDVKTYIHAQPPMSAYTLATIEGMHFNGEIKDIFFDLVKSNKPYVKAGAIVGVSGLRQVVFNGIMKMTGRDTRSFSTLQLAKDWLASQN
jgi:hypothetical protein